MTIIMTSCHQKPEKTHSLLNYFSYPTFFVVSHEKLFFYDKFLIFFCCCISFYIFLNANRNIFFFSLLISSSSRIIKIKKNKINNSICESFLTHSMRWDLPKWIEIILILQDYKECESFLCEIHTVSNKKEHFLGKCSRNKRNLWIYFIKIENFNFS